MSDEDIKASYKTIDDLIATGKTFEEVSIGTIFGRKVGIWQGNSRGSGRFSFSIRA